MGLDNGIVLKYSGRIEFPEHVKIEKAYDTKNEYDVCYFRKCYSIRRRILDAIHQCAGVDDRSLYTDVYEFDLTITMLERIQDELAAVLKYPDEWDSLWSLDEQAQNIAQSIVNISWLIEFMEEHPKALAMFYDSY